MNIKHTTAICIAISIGPTANIANAATFYFHNDHLGTPQALSNENQQVVWQGDYQPFGQVTETVNNIEQNLRFPGQYQDQETGLHYNYFRDYNPQTGRYLQSDPIGLEGGLNTYVYVQNNPVSYIDPTGEVLIAGAAVGGVVGSVGAFTGALATGSSLGDAAIAGGIGLVVGAASGFFGGIGIGASTVIGGGANLATQLAINNLDPDSCNDFDINWGSAVGSAVGSGWAGAIAAGAGLLPGAIIGWGPSTSTAAIGTALWE